MRCAATAAGGAPQCDRVDGHTGSHAVYEEGKAFRWGVGLALTEETERTIGVWTDRHACGDEAEVIHECLDALAVERDRNVCDACAGTGIPTSGPGCMCGGSGRMSDAVHYLRERYAAEHVRAEHAETERDDLQERLTTAVGILDARHTGVGAIAANEATRKAALDFIAAERVRVRPADPLRWSLCAHDILYKDCDDPRCAEWLTNERAAIAARRP